MQVQLNTTPLTPTLLTPSPSLTPSLLSCPCSVCQRNGNTNTSMMCQAYTTSTTTYDLAIYNPTSVSYNPTLTGISMFIQDGDYCAAAGIYRSLTVNFVCQQGPTNSIAFTNLIEQSTCQYVATVTTPAVCRQGRQNGICGSQNYDFSLAGTSEYSWVSPSGSYTYYFQPCGQVLNTQCNTSTATQNSMMCQAVNGAQTTYDIAYYDNQLVSWYKITNGMQMFVQDGQSCSIAGQVYDRALTVNFICGSTAVFNNLTETASTPCNYVAYVTTPQACAPITNGGSTGLSLPGGGSSSTGNGLPAYEAVTQCGGPYNLLPLSTSDLMYYPPNQEYRWVLRVCGAVSSDANCTAAAVNTPGGYMLCQDSQYGYGAYEASSYNQYTATWAATRNGVVMTMADGAACGTLGLRVTRLWFSCNTTATTASIYNLTESPQCTYNVYIYTSLVCPTVPTTCAGAGYDLSSLTTRGDLTINTGGYNCQAQHTTQTPSPHDSFTLSLTPSFLFPFLCRVLQPLWCGTVKSVPIQPVDTIRDGVSSRDWLQHHLQRGGVGSTGHDVDITGCRGRCTDEGTGRVDV
jgi:hypothetical protein